MSTKTAIHTTLAPEAIGCYSQAIKVDSTVYLSGQIALDPVTMQLKTDINDQIHQVFKNLASVCTAANSSLNEIVKINVYLTDLGNFAQVNAIMATYFTQPYPARAAVGVAALPRGAAVEMDAILQLPHSTTNELSGV